jgi:hypothetical protein
MKLHGQVPPAILHCSITSEGCIARRGRTDSGQKSSQVHFTHTIDSSLGAGPRKCGSFAVLVLSLSGNWSAGSILKCILQICHTIKLWPANQDFLTVSCFLCGRSECSSQNSDILNRVQTTQPVRRNAILKAYIMYRCSHIAHGILQPCNRGTKLWHSTGSYNRTMLTTGRHLFPSLHE